MKREKKRLFQTRVKLAARTDITRNLKTCYWLAANTKTLSSDASNDKKYRM